MEKETYLYHCAQCGELFHAPLTRGQQVCCVYCGNSPLAESRRRHHAAVAQGEDVADFVGIRRKKRRKNLKLTYAAWFASVALAAGGALYYKNQQPSQLEQHADEKAAPADEKEKLQKLQQKQYAALRECSLVLKQYDAANNINEKSLYVFEGVKKLVPMNAYFSELKNVKLDSKWAISSSSTGIKEGEICWLRLRLSNEERVEMEAVFLPEEGQMKLDWEQFVRHSSTSWNRFHLDKQIDSESDFRVYVRQRRRVTGEKDSGELELLFYEPKLELGRRGQVSPQLTLAKNDPMAEQIREKMAVHLIQNDTKGARKWAYSSNENGLLRVHVRLGYEVAKNGLPQLSLKKIYSFDWMDAKAPRGDDVVEVPIQ